ncbi:MAG: undecaprenyl-phosphate alpha-N-acetylglucosaminyl 1-phosphate transferase [Gammaproteobacteria bacterium]|nr:undecaprenyl-phosphate alpha-N-acetylglucosaminyl 1-phosphate transferase [Gammaproteobacteria bacterium]MCF6230290.1 undecaprenyl-phosphate alpha-N-acetylglucosaminyl 1-phosphate transferase [Gammaproteobacteria bacterium]
MNGFFGYLAAFAVTFFSVLLYIPVARRIGLVDAPGGRKHHDGSIPLVGGVAMFTGIALALFTLPIQIDHYYALIAGMIMMVAVGVIDDLKDLSARVRFLSQVIAALLMVYWGDTLLLSLGSALHSEVTELGVWAIPFTVFAVVGVVNATNMTDGVDGLAGSMALVILSAFAVIAAANGLYSDLMVLLVVISSVLAFLLFNFPIPGRTQAKVFMGDGGSMFLGFVIAWYGVSLTQGDNAAISPATALWVIGLPILDTIAIMTRRVLRGRSPFAPDREHFHHILQVAGFSKSGVIVTMMLISSLLAAIGLFGALLGVAEYIMFYGYLALLALYFWGVMHAWRVMKVIKKVGAAVQGRR